MFWAFTLSIISFGIKGIFYSHKITSWDFDWDYVDSIDQVGKNLHPDNLESLIHEHGMPPWVFSDAFTSLRGFKMFFILTWLIFWYINT